MTVDRDKDWTDENQQLLVAEFSRLRALLSEGDPSVALAARGRARSALIGPAAIDTLAAIFSLSAFEQDVLLLAAGVEMDAALARLCGESLGQPQQCWATFGLALALLPDAHWSALTPAGPLRQWRLIEVEESAGLTSARLRIDERILHYLAGLTYLDPRLKPLLQRVDPPEIMVAGQQSLAAQISQQMENRAGAPSAVELHGDDRVGREDVAAQVAASLGMGLYAIEAADVPTAAHELDVLATLWQREAALCGDALLVDRSDGAPPEVVQRFVERIAGLVFVSTREPIELGGEVQRFAVEKPEAPEQRVLWCELLGDAATDLHVAIDSIASQYRLSARTIGSAARQFNRGVREAPSGEPLLRQACREVEVIRLDALAQRIAPRVGWEDLVLPEAQVSALRQIAAQVRQRLRVYHDWGFAQKGMRGLGISALFSGESGTGKTMAAEVLATDLGLDLYRVDLSAVVSKYIGETEKNLRRVFDAAEESGAILLFDEADALFGKRSEVKDSHDRYANIEVSYLLQRMEAYRGLAILTTNLKASLDSAFQRRLRFVVHFPFPDPVQRESIWRRVFPNDVPQKDIEFAKLARLEASGGSIKNVALNATFLAADADVPVGMAHLLQAAHAEAAKRERPMADAESRGWVARDRGVGTHGRSGLA